MINVQFYYPRPVLAFGYCRCLHLSMCPCVSINHLLVCEITRDSFKLGSPNLEQRCKRPWLRFLIFYKLRPSSSMNGWVHLSVCPSVCLSHLFDYAPVIASSWNFQELLPMTKVTSMQKVKFKGQGHRGQQPTWLFPDRYSSLNSDIMMKWCTELDVA